MQPAGLESLVQMSLSARRAWIEIRCSARATAWNHVALRKESVDRNLGSIGADGKLHSVALRKESVDRNNLAPVPGGDEPVAFRKESVDRNLDSILEQAVDLVGVALRKESVDRNFHAMQIVIIVMESLSARRAWIEMMDDFEPSTTRRVALRKESVDRNRCIVKYVT